MAAFDGIPPEALRFFEQLTADNTKSFWTEHKPVYDKAVRAPMVALTDELAKTYGPFTIFRPNRDIRFSKDKTPYKTNIAGSAETEGGASVYVSFSAEGLYAGTGYYFFAKDQLDRYRQAVAADGTGSALEKLVAAARKKGYDVHGQHLKIAPRGLPEGPPAGRVTAPHRSVRRQVVWHRAVAPHQAGRCEGQGRFDHCGTRGGVGRRARRADDDPARGVASRD